LRVLVWGGANDGSGGAPAPPTAVGPMEPLVHFFFVMDALRGEVEVVDRWK